MDTSRLSAECDVYVKRDWSVVKLASSHTQEELLLLDKNLKTDSMVLELWSAIQDRQRYDFVHMPVTVVTIEANHS